MADDELIESTSSEQSGSQSQVPPATQVSAELDGFTITSASAVAPHTEASLKAAVEETATETPDAGSTRSPDAEAAAAATPPPSNKPEKPAPRKKTGEERHDEIQARINAATRELREAERRTAALREEAERMQAQTPPPQAIAARPRWKDYEEQGKTYQDYEEDLASWDEQRDSRNQQVVEQRLAAQQQEDQRRRDKVAYEARCDEARGKHPDWDETIKGNLNDIPQTPFLVTMVQGHPKGPEIFYEWGKNPDVARTWAEYDADPAMRPTPPILSALYESAHPSAMLEHLASHPDEYIRLTRMAPVSALLALGKLETALGANNGSPKRPVSHAAAPLSHRAGSQQRGTAHASDDESLEIEDYVRTLNKREGKFSPV